MQKEWLLTCHTGEIVDKKIEDFDEALHESIIKNFGSVENAQAYADKLEIKNKSRSEAFLKRMKERKNEKRVSQSHDN